jgi:sugar lactone lactonase YvrE
LRRLHEQFGDELVIISVHSAKFPSEKLTANIREAILRHDIRHLVVNDAGFQIWNQYGVRAWPTVVLIDPAGNLIAVQPGEIEADAFELVIRELIEEFDRTGELDRRPLDLRPEVLSEPDRPLRYPSKLLFTPDGRLFIADTGHHRILEVRLSTDADVGEIVCAFGSGQPGLNDGPAGEAAFNSPHGMALQGDALYVADTDNHLIRAIDLMSGAVRTVAGTGEKGRGWFDGEDSSPTEIPLRSPWALVAEDNVLFIAMAGSHQIWGLVDENRLGIFAGNGREALVDRASFNQPSGLALGMGHLFVADSEASAIRAISLGHEARVMTLIGQGLFEFGDVDGVGGAVRLQHPTGIAFEEGAVYIADSYNHKIKRLDPTTGHVETVVGTGQPGRADGPFSRAELFEPEGLAFHEGRLYIADTNNHLVRMADLENGVLCTIALEGLQKLS